MKKSDPEKTRLELIRLILVLDDEMLLKIEAGLQAKAIGGLFIDMPSQAIH